MKVIFAPFNFSNPYQKNLAECLSLYDVDVQKGNSGTFAFFKTKGIEDADVLHFHWLDPFFMHSNPLISRFKLEYFLYQLKRIKKAKKIVWTVHNLHNHEKNNLDIDRQFMKRFIKMVDAFSVHSEFAKQILVQDYLIDANKIHVIRHGNFIGLYPGKITETNSLKQKFNIKPEEKVFMFLGHIRPYKGILDLIDAFKNIELPNVRLLICGQVKFEEDKVLIEKLIKDDKRILFIPKFISDNEISNYLSIADVMLYPYKDILTSGALILGMSYRKCCLASNIASMPEYLNREFLFSGTDELKKMIENISILDNERLKEIADINYSRVEKDDWMYMARETFKLYN